VDTLDKRRVFILLSKLSLFFKYSVCVPIVAFTVDVVVCITVVVVSVCGAFVSVVVSVGFDFVTFKYDAAAVDIAFAVAVNITVECLLAGICIS
jgi:hypothetical protein